MIKPFLYLAAAMAEIAGCYSFWAWLKLEKTILWLIPGTLCLWLFAYLLTFIEAEFAGRAYAFYGGVYICSSIAWMGFLERNMPDKWDCLGAALCILGALFILLPKR